MALTQESVLSLLISEGGRVKKSDLVGNFKDSLNCDDPKEKAWNRERFKTFVNNVAFVKEIDGVRYVVVKKMYQHAPQSAEKTENKEIQLTGEQQRPPAKAESSEDAGEQRSADSEPDQVDLQASQSDENPSEILSPFLLALQRSKMQDFKGKRVLSFETKKHGNGTKNESVNKPCALPLRLPPSATRVEIHKLKVDPDDPPEGPKLDPFRNKRRPSVESNSSSIVSSPQLRRAVKSTKASEETRLPSSVPLEHSEHEWLVKCASGHWSLVYGLLLGDNQLAEKRDFMSGFTALHWAAKCGNSDMLVKIVDLSRKGGVDVDINAKTYGGYTPLHIAALHNKDNILTMLVGELGADPSIRDNCGKRAYHYLHKDTSKKVREMLGEPKVQERVPEKILQEREEQDLFPDLSKGLQSISRLFQPHMTGQKKKHKQRPTFYSMSEEPSEEREDNSGFRHRMVSDAFM